MDHGFGRPKNSQLMERLEELRARVEKKAEEAGGPIRWFKDLRYSTLEGWSRKRRVVAKASR